MNKGQAIKAGLIGGVVMTLVMAGARALGLAEANHEMLLGTLIGLKPSGAAWLVGFFIHLGLSASVAVIYVAAFELWLFRADWKAGIALGGIHSLFAGLFSRLLPGLHPAIPEEMPAPGPMWSSFGMDDTVIFIAVRLIFGATVGKVYQVERGGQLQYAGACPQDDKQHHDAA